MKRYLIFVLLGPPIGFLTSIYGLLPALNWAVGGESTFDWRQISLLPLAYALGIVPALFAAAFDAALAARNIHLRPLWTSVFGFVVSFLPLAAALLAGFLQSPIVLLWGLIGAVPGAACSWLSGGGR